MYAVLIVDIWKTTPFMALLCLAGLQMIPRDMYEAAKIDGIHPVKVFFKVTPPLVKPALMVAVIFRLLDALRIFDLIYVLTPNLGDEDHVGDQPREPDRLRQVRLRLGAVDAAVPDHRALGRPLHLARQGRSRGAEAMSIVKTGLFYLAVVLIVVVAVFPFYYAITSFKTGTALFEVNYWPTEFNFANYIERVQPGRVPAQHPQLGLVATVTVALALLLGVTASYALARVRFRGRTLLLLTILGVSMFPQIAVLAGLFELIRFIGVFNTPWALIISYTIFTLPFTVWVLTTFMRDLPIEIEEAAIVDGATPGSSSPRSSCR